MTEADRDAVAGLLRDERQLALHGPDVDEPRLRRGLVAEEDRAVVAAASGLTSARHPARNELAIHVDANHRRRGIATALLARLTAGFEAGGVGRSWLATIDGLALEGRSFLLARGFHSVVTSRSGTVEIEDAALTPEPLPAGYRVDAAEVDDGVVDLYERLYDENHMWTNGYVRYARGRAWFSFVGEPVAGSTFVATDPSGEPIGVLGLVDERDKGAFLVPGGVLRRARHPGGEAVVANLLAMVLDVARSRGLRTLRWEEDDPYLELRAVLGRLPIAVTQRLEAFADG